MTRLSQFLILASLTVGTQVQAQDQVTLRQQTYPISLPMDDETVEWQRDVYRDLLLTDHANQGLYCPMEPSARQKGLFTTLFRLAMDRAVPLYRYAIDGNEVFSDATRIDIKDVLQNQHIFFTEEDGKLIVDPDDVPSSDVLEYYIKEGVYYDLKNSTFRTRVLALCPVLVQDDDFSDGRAKYPLFWMEYKDVEPHLKGLRVIADYDNVAGFIPVTDYFTLNRYKGEIYKVANAFGRTLAQECDNDSLLELRQQAVEDELVRVRKPVYNIYVNDKAQKNEPVTPAPKKKRRHFPWQREESVVRVTVNE